ncbi:MAG TPA: hypothetical protein PK961_06700, partial [bacterium]|nr:hypothetical protein [bacterium]
NDDDTGDNDSDDDTGDDDNDDDTGDDDDTMLPEPTLFIIGKSGAFLKTDSGWKSYPYAGSNDARDRQLLSKSMNGHFALEGRTIFASVDYFNDVWYYTDGFEIWTFNLADGWQKKKHMFYYNMGLLHAWGDEQWMMYVAFYQISGFQIGRLAYYNQSQINWIVNSTPVGGSQFFFDQDNGMFAYFSESNARFVRLEDGVPALRVLPGHPSDLVTELYLFDLNNGWAISMDESFSNSFLWRDVADQWTLVDPPVGCPGKKPSMVKFADENYGVVTVSDDSDQVWLYDHGVWSCPTLPVPSGWIGAYAYQLHVVAPGWFYIAFYCADLYKTRLFEVKDGVTTEIELPAGVTYLTGVFTLGSGSPRFAAVQY